MHDDTQVARVYEMKEALADGAFPVRWVENLGYGYGYPIFNFYAPLAYYVGGIFNLIGFDSLVSTKIMFGLGMILAGVSMYFFAKEFWGRNGAILSAILYVYAPYHALNMYVRGAIAELWAYAFVPVLFLGLYKLYASLNRDVPKKKTQNKSAQTSIWTWIGVTACSYAAIVLSHNLTALMITPFAVLIGIAVWALSIRKRRFWYAVPASFLLAALLSAFYWLPVAFEMRYTNVMSVVGGGSDYKDHFVCFMQLWDSPWLYGGSLPGCMDAMSFKIGKLHILIGILSLVPLFLKRKDRKILLGLTVGYIGFFITTVLTLEYAKPIWDAIRQMSFLQFPWRFLTLASFFLSFIGGAIVLVAHGKVRIAVTILVVTLVVFINKDDFVPSANGEKTLQEYTDKRTIQWEVTKKSDEYLPQGFQKPQTENDLPKEKIVADKSKILITSISSTTQSVSANISAKERADLQLNLAYFPAWKMYINNKETPYKNTSTGMRVTIPKGESEFKAVFTQTPIQQISNILSMTGVILLITAIIIHRKDKRSVAKIT
jgi:uncharacterized membrane protein